MAQDQLAHATVRTVDGGYFYMGQMGSPTGGPMGGGMGFGGAGAGAPVGAPGPEAFTEKDLAALEGGAPPRGGLIKKSHFKHLVYWVVTLCAFVAHATVYTAGMKDLGPTKKTVYLFRVSLVNSTVKAAASLCNPDGGEVPQFYNVFLFNYCEGIYKAIALGQSEKQLTCCSPYQPTFYRNVGTELVEALPRALFQQARYDGGLLADTTAQFLFVVYTVTITGLGAITLLDLFRIVLLGRDLTSLRLASYVIMWPFLLFASSVASWMMFNISKPIAAGGATIEAGVVILYLTWIGTFLFLGLLAYIGLRLKYHKWSAAKAADPGPIGDDMFMQPPPPGMGGMPMGPPPAHLQ